MRSNQIITKYKCDEPRSSSDQLRVEMTQAGDELLGQSICSSKRVLTRERHIGLPTGTP